MIEKSLTPQKNLIGSSDLVCFLIFLQNNIKVCTYLFGPNQNQEAKYSITRKFGYCLDPKIGTFLKLIHYVQYNQVKSLSKLSPQFHNKFIL